MKRLLSCLAVLAVTAACSEGPARPMTAPTARSVRTGAPSFDVTSPASLNIATNGSFEDPKIPSTNQYPWVTVNAGATTLTGWSVETGTVDVQSGEPGAPYTNVPDGSQVLDLNASSISQTLTTVPGMTYQISISLSENYAILHGAPVSLEVDFGGTAQTFVFIDPIGSSANMRWDAHTFTAVAPTGATVLRIRSAAGGNVSGGPMIDAVQVQPPTMYQSGSDVMTWDPLPSPADPNWTTDVCTDNPAVGLADPRWANPHHAYVLGGHPWAYSYFYAPWINAWPNLQDNVLAYAPYNFSSPYYNWSKYTTTVSGSGDYVIQLLADNCSWVYLDNKLIGVQTTDLSKNTYAVRLDGTSTLTFLIFDGGGAAGGKFLFQTYQAYVNNGGDPSVVLPPPAPNTPPTVSAHNASVTVNEGSTASNSGAVADGDGDAVALSASVGSVTNNGDGTWSWSYATTDGPSQSQTVTITANDGQGNTASTSFALTVNNVPPAVNAGSGATIESGASFSLNASFADPGADAPWATSVDWGDGSAPMTGSSSVPGAVTGAHQYFVPGTYTVTVSARDKDGASGSATVTVTVKPKAVLVDIKPESDVNPINLGSGGVTPVAVLSGNGFDATTIDPATVRFGPAQIAAGAHHSHFEDVNGDGATDYLGQFDTDSLGLTTADTQACLTGKTITGIYIAGCDHITVVPPKGKGGK